MSDKFFNIPFSVQNRQRRYPLASSATGVSTSGDFTLPDDFIVWANLPITANKDVSPSNFFVRSIGVYDTGYAIVIAYQDGVDVKRVASAWINKAGHTEDTRYRLGGVDEFIDTVGDIVIGRIDGIELQPSGAHEFDLEATRITPDAVRRITRSVTSLTIVNRGERYGPYYGNIELEAGANTELISTVEEGQPTKIRFNAIEGAGLSDPCECDGNDTAPCIRRIDGIPATESGNFIFLGKSCVEFRGIANGLEVNDRCAEPCCGCKELEDVTDGLRVIESEKITLISLSSRLEASTQQFTLQTLGNALGDQGCDTCPEEEA